MRYFSRIARASAKLVGSATVGPEAITAGSSPGTSEISRLTTRAGAAAAARRPPLMAERCLRRQFISSMAAPERSSARSEEHTSELQSLLRLSYDVLCLTQTNA